MSEHIHTASSHEHTHDHIHDQPSRAFPAYAENLLQDLVHAAKNGTLTLPAEWSAHDPDSHNLVLDIYNKHKDDIQDIEARSGEQLSTLTFSEYSAVMLAFEEKYQELPAVHPGFEHDHHEGDHHDCGKIHGPLRRQFDKFERKVLGKISNRRAHALATAAFRLSALTVCPGDDLAAIGMQAYGAISGQASDSERHKELAVLPRRPRIDFANNKFYFPLDVAVGHDEIPNTKAGAEARGLIDDVRPMQQTITTERVAKEAAAKPEKRRRARRIMALGAMALAALGVGFGDTIQNNDSPKVVSALENAPTSSVQPVQPIKKPNNLQEITKRPDSIVQHITVQKGDSQWKITEKRVEQATGAASPAVINVATAYMSFINRTSHPDANIIKSGDRILTASAETIKKLDTAVSHPEKADPKLVKYITILNTQASHSSDKSQQALKQLNGYLRG